MRKNKRNFECACAIFLVGMFLIAGGPWARGEELISDYSSLDWTEAFTQLHSRLSQEYAFTDWKGIEWRALGDIYGKKVDKAQTANDFEAYYLALRAYIHEIPDGHVRVTNLTQIDEKYIGGSFGFTAAEMNDGRLVVTWVDEASQAWKAGMRAGNELLTWNTMPVLSVLDAVSAIFDGNSATLEDARNKKVQYLTRAPVGTHIDMTYRSQDSSQSTSIALTAYDDGGFSFKKGYPAAVISDKIRDMIRDIDTPDPVPEAMVELKILEGNIGYIKVWGELDADLHCSGLYTSTLSLFRQAVKSVMDAGCGGLILDLRNNVGGEDAIAAAMLSSFYSEKVFYEYQNTYDPITGMRSIRMADAASNYLALWIEPAELVYMGRVIALINQKCVSSGEGIAMGIRNLPEGETLGFFETNGSFGLCGPEATMPGGITIHWPSGQSLDESLKIQLDSRDGMGGVAPTIRIPMTQENALRIARGEDVEIEEAIHWLNRH